MTMPPAKRPKIRKSSPTIKQDERLRKDMHLSFVHNAFHQKSLVRLLLLIMASALISSVCVCVKGQSRALRRSRRAIQHPKLRARPRGPEPQPPDPPVAPGAHARRLAPRQDARRARRCDRALAVCDAGLGPRQDV